jgi:hypothetical protein
MHAAKRRVDAGVLPQKSDAGVKLRTAKKNVIEHGWNLRLFAHKELRCSQESSGQREEKPPREWFGQSVASGMREKD